MVKRHSPSPTSVRILEVIDKPLGFYVLSLLIVESFLGCVLVGAKSIQATDAFYGLCLGVGMFVLVVIVVTIITLWRPQNLTYDRDAHLIDRGKAQFGTDRNTVSDRDAQFPTRAQS